MHVHIFVITNLALFAARLHVEGNARFCYGNSVCPSVPLSVCPSVCQTRTCDEENEIIVCQYINTVRYIDISSFLRPFRGSELHASKFCEL